MSAVADVRSTHRQQLQHRSRSSGLVIAVAAVFLVPAWGVFDQLLTPHYAATFVTIRLLCDIPVLVLMWLLWRRPVGLRRPELLTFAVLAVVQAEIAWMAVRAGNATDFYLLGFSLALFASGCVMGGRPRWTGAVVGATWLALAIALLTAPTPISRRDLSIAGFYLSTASLIGFIAHLQRDRLSTRERLARELLEEEQHHTRMLMSRLERLSHEDALTGLANRRRWDAELQTACAHTRANGPPLAVLLLDIDRFKVINDSNGHAAGDQTLRDVAILLCKRVRGGDLVARLGGDEYGILLRDTEAVGAAELAEHLRAAIYRLPRDSDGELSVSVGVAAAAGDEAHPDQVMTRADAQLYRAKTTRNAVAV